MMQSRYGRTDVPNSWNVLLLFSAVLWTWSGVQSNTFTAIVKLKQLPGQEGVLIAALENYTIHDGNLNSETYGFLQEFLSRTIEANALASEDVAFVEKPTNAFLFMRRLAESWEEVSERICSEFDETKTSDDTPDPVTEFCHKFEAVTKTNDVWPSKSDVIGAATAIIRLVDFYKLSLDGLAHGTIFGIEVLPLSPDDFLFISDVANDDDQDRLAALWYEYTLHQLQEQSTPNIIKITRIQRRLAGIYYSRVSDITENKMNYGQHNRYSMYNKAAALVTKAVHNNPSHAGAKKDLDLYQHRKTADGAPESTAIPRPTSMYNSDEVLRRYRKLCRGQLKTEGEQAELYCEYRKTSVPLIPSRVEYANVVPPVVLIHQVVTDREISHLKELAKSYLHRSVIGDTQTTSSVRISQSAWIGESDAILMDMSRKVELHTGLSAMYTDVNTHAELWQVLNYGLGGLYVPHDDSVKFYRDLGTEAEKGPLLKSGDRLATFLIYLNDVTAGGATVYPHLKARVPVVKGAAALWYNLYRNGNPDTRVLHAGCPVLIGSKWVSNKWIREVGQTFKWPCALDPNI